MVDFSYGWGCAGASTWFVYNAMQHNRYSKGIFLNVMASLVATDFNITLSWLGFVMYPILFMGYGYLLAGLGPDKMLRAHVSVGTQYQRHFQIIFGIIY